MSGWKLSTFRNRWPENGQEGIGKTSKKHQFLLGIRDAFERSMSVVIIAIGFVLAGLIICLFATATAPVGYEDQNGFHFGQQHGGSMVSRDSAPLRQVPSASQLSPKPA
jgi:hypothetical protein